MNFHNNNSYKDLPRCQFMTEYDFDKLKEKHKNILENQAVRKIANWRDPLYHPDLDFSEEEYTQRALRNLKSLKTKGFVKSIETI